MTTVQKSDRNGLFVPTLRQPLIKLAMLVAGFLIGLVLVEIVLRVVGFSYPSFWTLDAERGWAARPGTEGRYIKEGNAYVRINREGFRDFDHEKQSPLGTFRIAVLGDSFVEALQVELESTFWKVMEGELSVCASLIGQHVEVLGFGGSGYGTAQERITYRTFVRQYQPDLVVLAFFIGNDVSDNSRALNNLIDRPYYTYDGDRLTLDLSFRDRTQFRVSNLRRGHLVSLVDKVRLLQIVKETQHVYEQYLHRMPGNPTHLGPGTESQVFVPPRNNDWIEAWRVTEGILDALRDDVEKDGSRLWVLAIPAPEQVHPDSSFRREFMKKLGVEDLSYPEARLQMWAERASVPFVELSNEFSRIGTQNGDSIYGFGDQIGFGHWNENGHRLAGKILAQRICQFCTDHGRN